MVEKRRHRFNEIFSNFKNIFNMKTRIFTMLLVAVMASISLSAFAGRKIDATELPRNARVLIAKYYPNDRIKKVKMEKSGYGIKYEVDMMSGAELEFAGNGEWLEIEASKRGAVPAGLVPAHILRDVKRNYRGVYIVKIEKERGGYEVKLSNHKKIRFAASSVPRPGHHHRHHR